MSPELYAGLTHSPVKDDIFALGYSLFIIVARHPPFKAATLINEHYRLLKENKVLEYWNLIDSAHSPEWCTNKFKHLITIMLTFDISLRPSLSEIQNHPWTQGKVPSENEVISEFEQKQYNLLKYQRQQAILRHERRHKNMDDIKNIGNGLSGADTSVRAIKWIEESLKVNVKKILKSFGKPEQHKPIVLMSQESPERIEAGLISFFSVPNIIKTDQEKYKVIYLLSLDYSWVWKTKRSENSIENF